MEGMVTMIYPPQDDEVGPDERARRNEKLIKQTEHRRKRRRRRKGKKDEEGNDIYDDDAEIEDPTPMPMTSSTTEIPLPVLKGRIEKHKMELTVHLRTYEMDGSSILFKVSINIMSLR